MTKLMVSDLLYDADIVIKETIKGKTYYYQAELEPSVEDAYGIISTIIISKGKRLSIREVMSGDRE